jgi:hypothetical protein
MALPMADCDDHIACAVREVNRRGGAAIWADPGRLRSRLHYEMGAASTGQSELLDALVIAAMQGIPGALLADDDLEGRLLVLAESVGPDLAGEAIDTWVRALAEPDLVCADGDTKALVLERVAKGMVIDARCVEVRVLGLAPVAMDDGIAEQLARPLIDKLRPPPPVPVSA